MAGKEIQRRKTSDFPEVGKGLYNQVEIRKEMGGKNHGKGIETHSLAGTPAGI